MLLMGRRFSVESDNAIEARRISDDAARMKFGMSNLFDRSESWTLGLKLHEALVFGSYEVFQTRLRQTF